MKFGLIGHPVAHSFSPSYFKQKFAVLGLPYSYEAKDLESLSDVKSMVRAWNWRGFNVTIPHKQGIMPFLDEVDKDASAIGAVNTVSVVNNQWKGFNTDHIGFGRTLDSLRTPEDRSALILGDGGAAKAVKYALEQRGITYQIVRRSGDLDYDQLHPNHIRAHQIIINTTPLGMSPKEAEFPPIPYEAITPQHLLYDLIYHPAETAFLRKGRLLGARTINGESMLHLQADESWQIWEANL